MATATLNFNFEDDKIVEFSCMIANARDRFKTAVLENDKNAMIYNGTAMAAYLDVLGLTMPDHLRPDGSESNKP